LGLNLKSATVKEYIKVAALLSTNRGLDDPFNPKEPLKENFPLLLTEILKKYEGMADRKEPVADAMFILWINKLAKVSHQDSLGSVLRDFFVWSRDGGPRRSEWCQTKKTSLKL